MDKQIEPRIPMQRELKWVGWFFIVLGLFALYAGAQMFAGGPIRTEGGSCRSLCGLALLANAVFGEPAGSYVGGTLWLLIGAAFTFTGVKLMK